MLSSLRYWSMWIAHDFTIQYNTIQYNTIQYNILHVPCISVPSLPPLLPWLTSPVSGIKMAGIHAPWPMGDESRAIRWPVLRRGQLPVECALGVADPRVG